LLSSHEVGRIRGIRDQVLHVILVFVPRVFYALIGFGGTNVHASAGAYS
jgi:hypothetical protein